MSQFGFLAQFQQNKLLISVQRFRIGFLVFVKMEAIHMTERKKPKVKSRPQLGFSLVELVCVIGIMIVIVALLLPAIQSMRESARKVSCLNQLKQLGLALSNHESAFKKFPPGTLGTALTPARTLSSLTASGGYDIQDYQNTSWIVFVLPYLDEANLSQQIPSICSTVGEDYKTYRLRNSGAARLLIEDVEIQKVIERPLRSLMCPTDELSVKSYSKTRLGSQPTYYTDLRSDYFSYFLYDGKVAGTNYAGCSGAGSGGYHPNPDIQRFNGLFRSRIAMRVADVTDGTTSTIAFGETLGQIDLLERTDVNSWLFSTLCRGRSDMPWMQSQSIRRPGLKIFGDSVYSYRAGFGSRHPHVVQFAMTSGATASLSREIDIRLLYQLCGSSDNEVISGGF